MLCMNVYFENTCTLAIMWPDKFCALAKFQIQTSNRFLRYKMPLSFHEGLIEENGR